MHPQRFCTHKKFKYTMKKFLIIGLLAMMGLGMTGCTINSSSEPSGSKIHQKTIDLNVKASSWIWDAGANMYYCHFDLPELTSDIYNYAEVSVNREYKPGTKDAYQVALPETTYLTETVNNQNVFYQQHIDYAYGVGFVEIFLTLSDFYYEGFHPEAMYFRLQLTY